MTYQKPAVLDLRAESPFCRVCLHGKNDQRAGRQHGSVLLLLEVGECVEG